MIKSISFIEGFPLELPLVGRKEFKFKEGLNILFGPNGCGKSTILNTLKSYCGIKGGGWTNTNNPKELGFSKNKHNQWVLMADAKDFPHGYFIRCPGKSLANVWWDGTATFYNDGGIAPSSEFALYRPSETHDGITSEEENFLDIAEKPSSGQYRIQKLNKIISLLKRGAPTSKGDYPPSGKMDMFFDREWDYWMELQRTRGRGSSTILFDEPERSLSLSKQKDLFERVLLSELNEYQVIVATHSIFALPLISNPNVNFIEMERGYAESCKNAIIDFSAQYIQNN